ncbi:MAG: protein kinase [Blastocatellales bacterium]
MTIDQWRQVKELFEASLEREPSARAHFIADQSNGDDAIRQAAEQMLRDFDESSDFLEAPALVEFGFDGAQFDPGYEQGRRIGPYRIVGEIGQGGMGAVYLAERADDAYEKRVAIKMVWPGGIRSEINRRFNIERRVLAALEHPNIARLLDGGVTEDGWSYVVMEYVDGVPITTYCEQRKLSVAERLRLFQSVCEAVQYAHQNLIVHRDLKPSNILVTHAGEVKLLDFGIAKILDPTDDAAGQSQTLLNFLTPEYASPEHISGQRISTASDVYSLGVLLYELLTGARPFNPTSRSPQELIRLIETHEPARPSLVSAPLDESIRKQLRGDLDNILLKALQKEPLRRYQSVRQFSEDLTRHLNGDTVIAREATLAYRLGKRIRRNKALTVGLTLIGIALITGLIVSRQQLQASQARERQQRYELYAADMRQAGSDWGEGNLVQMDELLERHRPGNGIDDEWRGFEWFALWKLLHTEKFTLHHQAWAPTVVYTPDGKTILTGSRDGRIEMWDAQVGQSLGLFTVFSEGVFKLLLSADGKKLVAGGYEGKVGIWEFPSRRLIAELPSMKLDLAYPALSPDGQKLALKVDGHPIRIFDTNTGQLEKEYPIQPNLDVIRDGPALYSPSGRLYFLTRKHWQWELWDVMAGQPTIILNPNSANPNALVPFFPTGYLFSRDGKRFYLATQDYLVRAWDTKTGQLTQVFIGHKNNVETPAISFDDKLLATGGDDKTLRLWDTQTGKQIAVLQNESQTFSPIFSPDNKFLAAVCMRAFRVKVWEVAKLQAEKVVFDGVISAKFTPDNKSFLAFDSNNRTVLRDFSSGQLIPDYPPISTDTAYNKSCFSPDAEMIAYAIDSIVEVREVKTGKTLATLKGHYLPILVVAFSPDGKTLVTSGEDRIVKVWNTSIWKERAQLRGHKERIWNVNFSPDGSKFATASYDDTVKIWKTVSGENLMTLRGHRAWVASAVFSPDGKVLASGCWDYTIKLWDTTTGQEVRTLTGHANSVYAVAFSPDGRRLVSGGDDQTIRIWDVSTGIQLTALYGHTGRIWQVSFTQDGQILLSSSEKETRIWRAATEEEVRALPVNR